VATAFDDDEHLFSALKAGAKGYLLKAQTAEEFTQSLRGILNGEPAISPVIARKLISHFNQSIVSSDSDGLSNREAEILALTAKGFTRVEVSDYLEIRPNTVASHLKAVYRKLDVTNRAEATLEALRLGLLN
jgi:DNA-binding NarL/FixJ family response regulator